MDFKEISKYAPLIILIILGMLVFLLVKPLLPSILGGLILAYTFFPVYKRVNKIIKNDGVSAFLVLLFAIMILIVPLFLVTPALITQVFAIFKSFQAFNIGSFVAHLFPTAPEQFVTQITLAFASFISKLNSIILNYLTDLIVSSVNFLLDLFVLCFVFFYALKDNEKMKDLLKDLSPISKSKEKILKHQFKDITNSLIYGQVIVGIFQGLVAGLGFFIFGVPNALALTFMSIIFSLIPFIGPWIVWIPILISMLLSGGNTTIIILFLLYNLIIVSTVDNILRAYIISRKSNLSGGIIFVGMMGGLYLFGIFGLIVGPLILSYFITFFQSFKEESRFEVMEKDEPSTQNIPIIDKKIHLPFFEKK